MFEVTKAAQTVATSLTISAGWTSAGAPETRGTAFELTATDEIAIVEAGMYLIGVHAAWGSVADPMSADRVRVGLSPLGGSGSSWGVIGRATLWTDVSAYVGTTLKEAQAAQTWMLVVPPTPTTDLILRVSLRNQLGAAGTTDECDVHFQGVRLGAVPS